MWQAYWQTASTNLLDVVILVLGVCLVFAHLGCLAGRWYAKHVFLVQDLDRYRTFLLSLTELLPVLGLLGTVLSLMFTFKTFHMAAEGDTPDLVQMVQAFAPAMSTTISALLMLPLNLLLNAILWSARPLAGKGESQP